MKETFADLNRNGKRALRKEKIQTALVNCLFDGPGFGIGKAPLCNCSHVLGVKIWFGGQSYVRYVGLVRQSHLHSGEDTVTQSK